MKFARKALVVAAAVAFGTAMFAPAAHAGEHYSTLPAQCSNGGDQTQGIQNGLVNLGNVQVPVNADVALAGVGLGLLGLGSGSGAVGQTC